MIHLEDPGISYVHLYIAFRFAQAIIHNIFWSKISLDSPFLIPWLIHWLIILFIKSSICCHIRMYPTRDRVIKIIKFTKTSVKEAIYHLSYWTGNFCSNTVKSLFWCHIITIITFWTWFTFYFPRLAINHWISTIIIHHKFLWIPSLTALNLACFVILVRF